MSNKNSESFSPIFFVELVIIFHIHKNIKIKIEKIKNEIFFPFPVIFLYIFFYSSKLWENTGRVTSLIQFMRKETVTGLKIPTWGISDLDKLSEHSNINKFQIFIIHTNFINIKLNWVDTGLTRTLWARPASRALVKFDTPAIHRSGKTGFVAQTSCDLYLGESRAQWPSF